MLKQWFGCWSAIPCEYGGLPYGYTIRGICYWKMTSKQAFSNSVTLSTMNAWEAKFLWGRKGINRESVFRSLSSMNCLTSRMWDLQVCPQDLTSRVRSVCFPALSETCKHISKSYHDYPWGSSFQQCVWECWVPYCGYPDEVTFRWKWASSYELKPTCLLQKSQSVDQRYHCQM